MPENVLIIGSEGFIGRSFLTHHSKFNYSNPNIYTIDICETARKNHYKCNAVNFNQINKIIQKIKPEQIYNFSGSFSNEFETDYTNNVVVTKNILDAVVLNEFFECKVLINGSAAEYGLIKTHDFIVNESYPLNPINFYGLSKVYQTYLAQLFFSKYNIKVFIARPFNIIGSGISEKLFIGKLLNEIQKNIKTKQKIVLGNLDNERDYVDIEDLIYAYEKIIEKGNPGEIYNIGSGVSIKIRDLLNLFLKIFEIREEDIEISNNLIKKFEIPKIIADISKLKKLSWKPKISLENSIYKLKKSMFL